MSVLTSINGIPLFSTQQEALSWASSRGLSGYHTHIHMGQTGYMGGSTHLKATTGTQQTPQPTQRINTVTSSSGGGGY